MPSSSAKDIVSPYKGIFSMRVKDRSGNIVHEFTDHNMIVNLSKIAMAYLISENTDVAKAKIITTFGVGVGTAAASPEDTSLVRQYTNIILSHDFPEPGRVRFNWGLSYTEANGMDISEFGLFCADGSMFAHKVRGSIHKDEDLSFEGEWTIIF